MYIVKVNEDVFRYAQGDSGGPLISKFGSRWYVSGKCFDLWAIQFFSPFLCQKSCMQFQTFLFPEPPPPHTRTLAFYSAPLNRSGHSHCHYYRSTDMTLLPLSSLSVLSPSPSCTPPSKTKQNKATTTKQPCNCPDTVNWNFYRTISVFKNSFHVE